MKELLTNESIIRVYFNDLFAPTSKVYVTSDNNGRLTVLSKDDADKNCLVDIRELAGFPGVPTPEHEYENEMKFDNNGFLYQWYYEVKNGEFPMPFNCNDKRQTFLK